MPFPLRLTPFEEYMLVDDQPAYPMSCFFLLKLRGRFNVSLFESAFQKALENHPFLTSSVTQTSSVTTANGQFHWQDTGTMPDVIRLPLDAKRRFPASKGIDLFREPALKVAICNENTDPAVVELDDQTNLVFEVHHSASDAAGTARFIEDIFCEYARLTALTDERSANEHSANERSANERRAEACSADRQRADRQREPVEPVEPALLVRRGIFGQKRDNILRVLPQRIRGLFRAWKFLMHRIIPLTPQKPDRDAPMPPADYPAILCRDLTIAETQGVQQKAKQLGVTINDLFLCAAFFAMKLFTMKHWREQHITDKKRGYFRIAVPVNLRTPADDRMPAANIVSMVFLDRTLEQIQDSPSLYQSVCRETQHVKQHNLGWTFIRGLSIYQRVFGSFRKMVQQDRCWATATVTNLGRLFVDTPLPMREGRVQIDESLELIGVETSPPVRPWTALGISVLTYADCMTINLHYDSAVLTRSDAQSILDSIADDCSSSSRLAFQSNCKVPSPLGGEG